MGATFIRRLKLGEACAHRFQQRRILLTRERTALELSRVCQWRPYVLDRMCWMTIRIGRVNQKPKARISQSPRAA